MNDTKQAKLFGPIKKELIKFPGAVLSNRVSNQFIACYLSISVLHESLAAEKSFLSFSLNST